MSRILIAVLLLISGVSVGCSEQKPKGTDTQVGDVSYTVGDKRVMMYVDDKIETIWEVTAVEMKDGAIFVSESREQFARGKSLGPGMVSKIKVSDTGEYLLQEGDRRYDPPIRLTRPKSIKEGDSWEWDNPGVGKLKYKAGKEEEVEVPAGKFKARRIEGEGESDGKPTTCTEWRVPGLGKIKSVVRFDNRGEVVEVLKSFTPGKK